MDSNTDRWIGFVEAYNDWERGARLQNLESDHVLGSIIHELLEHPDRLRERLAGIDPSFRFHDLRHTAASQMIVAGVDLRTVGKILGHRTPQMALRYAHLSDEHMADAASKLQDRLRKVEQDSMDIFATPTENGTGLQRGAQS